MGREPLNTKTSKPKFSPARPSPVSTIIGTSPSFRYLRLPVVHRGIATVSKESTPPSDGLVCAKTDR
jgi:hypothetical protein